MQGYVDLSCVVPTLVDRSGRVWYGNNTRPPSKPSKRSSAVAEVRQVNLPYDITEFSGEYEFLSNFYECDFVWAGIQYPSLEHAYQSCKTEDQEEKWMIANCSTPGQAKRAGQRITLRSDWELVKVGKMESLLGWKFRSVPDLTERLRDTYPAHIAEGNLWGDTFWGVDLDTGEGANVLGVLLMELRDELIAAHERYTQFMNPSHIPLAWTVRYDNTSN
jgi:ribA/ribD-fused uncharacterized protein